MDKVDRKKEGERLPRPMTAEQIGEFFSRIDSLRDQTLFSLLHGSGVRVGEALGLNIEDFFLSGVPPNPIERTFLTTGTLEAAMISHGSGGQPIETPHLAISYAPAGNPRRPQGPRPQGACLEPWSLPEPGATPAAAPIPINRDGTIRDRQH